MKKNEILFFLFFSLPIFVFAQAPDTVIVPTTINEEPRDALAYFILGDTTASGQRNNPNRVYKLQRGQIYYLTGARAYNFNLTLIGDGNESLRPPVIAPMFLQDGSVPDITMSVNGNTYVRNIYFTAFTPTQQRNAASGCRALALGTTAASARGRLVVEKCIFEGFRSGAVSLRPPNSTIIMKDNIVRNFARDRIEFAASFLFVGASTPIDTIIMTNNTYFNGNNYFLCTNRNPNNYVRVEHNTVYINNVNPFFSFHLCNADIKNNLFIATASWAEKLSERIAENYDSQGQKLSVISLEHLPSNYGITDDQRRVVLKNNAYWWPDRIKNLWATHSDSIFAPVWINDRTDSIFTNKTRYPRMVKENNLDLNPGFTDNSVVTLLDSLYEHLYMLRIDPGRSVGKLFLYKWEFPCPWPLPEKFTYTNTTLLAGGDDGLPVGDLNWYPDKKKEWEQKYETIGIDDGKIAIPTEFKLEQNYPNPFNPNTMISFHVPKKANVSLKIYDILGREVSTLVNQVMEVGEHKVNFNANNLTTGVYFYLMKCDNFVSVKKMMLLK